MAFGCATPSGCEDDESPATEQAENTDKKSPDQPLAAIDDPVVDEPDGADEEALRWMRAGPGAVIVKLHLDALDERVAPVVDPVIDEVGGAMSSDFLEQFLTHGPLMVFDPGVVETEAVAELDKERAAYISLQPIAWDSSFFDVLPYGAVLQSEMVGPAGIHVRMLLPADHPQQIAESIDGYADDNREVGAVLTAGDHYLRVDVVDSASGGSDARYVDDHFDIRPGQRSEQLLEEATSRRYDASLRETPALATFLRSTAPASAYTRSDDLRVMQATNAIIEAMEALMMAAPERRQEVLSRGVAGALNALVFAPEFQFDHEDTVLELRAKKDRAMVVDTASTQSEHGRAVADHVGQSETLRDAPIVDDPVVDLRWNFDANAAVDQNPPPRVGGFQEFDDPHETDINDLVPGLAEYYRDGGILSYLSTIFISPSFIPRLFAFFGDDVARPKLGYVAFNLPEGGGAQTALSLGAVGLFDADDVEQHPPESVSGLKAQLEQNGVEVELINPADQPSRLDLVAGEMVGADNTDRLEVDADVVSASVELSSLDEALGGDDDLFDALDELSHLNVRWRVDDGITRQRYTFGDVQSEWPELAKVDEFAPMETTGVECTGRLVAEAIDIFSALPQISTGTPVDEMVEKLISDYDELAEDCAQDHPHLADHLDEVRARMRFILLFRTSVTTDGPEGMAALYDAICDAGDTKMCRDQ